MRNKLLILSLIELEVSEQNYSIIDTFILCLSWLGYSIVIAKKYLPSISNLFCTSAPSISATSFRLSSRPRISTA